MGARHDCRCRCALPSLAIILIIGVTSFGILPTLIARQHPMVEEENVTSNHDCFNDSFPDEESNTAASSTLPLKLQIPSDDVRIQVSSDLHTEFYDGFKNIPRDIIVPNAPVLALIGDIGLAMTESLKKFLHFQAGRFEHVLFVAGNHEYYNSGSKRRTVAEQLRWMKEVCGQRDNLHFLERAAVEINDVVILGTTLWSKIPRESMDRALSMNDYRLAYEAKNKTLTVQQTNYQFQKSLKWLEDQIRAHSARGKSIVVLTHHTPQMRGTSNPRYDGSGMGCFFSTDLGELLRGPVRYWACGHTHWNFDLPFDNGTTRLVSNQRGYPGGGHRGYDNEGVILSIPLSPEDGAAGERHGSGAAAGELACEADAECCGGSCVEGVCDVV